MSQRTFIVAMACLLLAAAGFVSWVILSSEKVAPLPQVVNSTSTRERTRNKVAHRTVHPNRYEGLTANNVRWQIRVDQLRRMDASSLNQTEIDFLYAQLRHQPSGQKEAWWVVMNEVMEQIVKQEIAPERITNEFTSIIGDKQLDLVVRDYAIQHLSVYLKNYTNEAGDLERSLTSIVSAIKDPENQHNSIPGTATMGLIEVSNNPKHQEKVNEAFGKLESYLMPLIKGEVSTSLANRTSAINAVGLIQAEEYLPVLRDLIATEDVNDSIKLSAIASIGDFYAASPLEGETSHSVYSITSDQELLQNIAVSDSKFKHAAIASLT